MHQVNDSYINISESTNVRWKIINKHQRSADILNKSMTFKGSSSRNRRIHWNRQLPLLNSPCITYCRVGGGGAFGRRNAVLPNMTNMVFSHKLWKHLTETQIYVKGVSHTKGRLELFEFRITSSHAANAVFNYSSLSECMWLLSKTEIDCWFLTVEVVRLHDTASMRQRRHAVSYLTQSLLKTGVDKTFVVWVTASVYVTGTS